MSWVLRAAAIGLSFFVGGCAIHPLPEDVTGVSTYIIVRKIRCEAREAVRLKAALYLKSLDYDPVALRIGAALDDPKTDITKLAFHGLKPETTAILNMFGGSAVAYNFAFDMTEINNLDATIDALKIVTNGKFSLGAVLGADRTRHSIRSFTVTDTFIGLLTDVKWDYCEGKLATGRNYLYPITGRIGIDEMIDTFVDLSLFANLAGEKGPPTISDSIEFQTNFSASVTPKIELSPVGHSFRLADASIVGIAKRQDSHKVIVGLSLPPKGAKPPPLIVGGLVNATGTPSELLAAHAVEQHITRFELGQRSVILNVP